mgnify:CR=1 FL=1
MKSIYVLMQDSHDDFPAKEPPYVYSSKEKLMEANPGLKIRWLTSEQQLKRSEMLPNGTIYLGSGYYHVSDDNYWLVYLVGLDA